MELNFNEPTINVIDAIKDIENQRGKPLSYSFYRWWKDCEPGKSFSSVHPKGSYFNAYKISPNNPCPTIIASSGAKLTHWGEPNEISDQQIIRLQSFPDDYKFLNKDVKYFCGMSVPPFMTQRLADQIAQQHLGVGEPADLKTGAWNLSDLKDVKKNGKKVLSIFACGGGSTMGYKLAGFDVICAVEIDPEMAEIYESNHSPKYLYRMAIQEFNKIPDVDLPEEFFDLDILDGSPPCSSFSMAGSREKKWGKSSHFKEGQAKQHLDDLFFHFIETAKKLKPKVVVAENVKGLIIGNAKGYVKQIFAGFREAGYETQLFLLNSSKMGVPQRRERTFFVARRL
jgi:site-specific DNA-cytosine methylase